MLKFHLYLCTDLQRDGECLFLRGESPTAEGSDAATSQDEG